MKIIKQILAPLFFLLFATLQAQVGVNTTLPDASSIMDLESSSRGLLAPRMTSTQRDLIVNPAQGLLIYNLSTAVFNYFDLGWKDFSDDYKSVTATNLIRTFSTSIEEIPGMTLLSDAGTYSVNFNTQYTNTSTTYTTVSTGQFITDLADLYNTLDNIETTNSTHDFNFGGGEILSPGKYFVNSAIAVGGELILDAGGNPDAVFIFKGIGAINLAADTTIILTGGAQVCNVFWISRGATSIGARCIMKGTVISYGYAIASGADSFVDGRLFTLEGAIAFGPGTATAPTALSATIDIKSLSNLLLFTGGGSINNTGTTTVYNGNICSHVGSTTSVFSGTLNGIIYPPGVTLTYINNGIRTSDTFITLGIYKNDVLIPSTLKTIKSNSGSSCALLQDIVSVAQGDIIDVRWKSEGDPVALGNRNLTMIKVKSE
jgi:hypothetical protein